jgi:hypothetical protein
MRPSDFFTLRPFFSDHFRQKLPFTAHAQYSSRCGNSVLKVIISAQGIGIAF